MLRAYTVMCTVEPGFQVREDEVDHRHELLGYLGITAFGDGVMVVAPFAEAVIATPVVWYHQQKIGGKLVSTYVGSVTDKSITSRVNRFAEIKSDFKQRQEMVRALAATGLPTPDALSGAIVEAMWKAGFFRLRGVLVGTVAFQAYAGPLGIKLGGRPLQTQDTDFAQFWDISENIGDSMPPVIEVLTGVDTNFEEVPNINDPFVSVAYRNARGYRVDMLTPNRGAAEHQGRPAHMKALRGSGAQPLPHLDFLIHDPERSVLLSKGGIAVTIPRAERYAVHKPSWRLNAKIK